MRRGFRPVPHNNKKRYWSFAGLFAVAMLFYFMFFFAADKALDPNAKPVVTNTNTNGNQAPEVPHPNVAVVKARQEEEEQNNNEANDNNNNNDADANNNNGGANNDYKEDNNNNNNNQPPPPPAPQPERKKQMTPRDPNSKYLSWADVVDVAPDDIIPVVFNSQLPSNTPIWDSVSKQRREEVKAEFLHAWSNYRKYAWGSDELKPQSKKPNYNFKLGLTIIDALDTIIIMDLHEEYTAAREWIQTKLSFHEDAEISLFENTIRTIGGLLAAHHLSGDSLFLEKAKELGKLFLLCFETQNGIPFPTINLATKKISTPSWNRGNSALSEIASLQLEYAYLAKHSGDIEYAVKPIAVITKLMKLPKFESGLYPIMVAVDRNDWGYDRRVTLGALGDSFYEYILKLWLLTGNRKYRAVYDQVIDSIIKYMVIREGDWTFVAELQSPNLPPVHIKKMDHLVCFLGGMIALGAVTNPVQDQEKIRYHLEVAHNVTATCKHMYDITPTHLAPEIFVSQNGEPIVNPSSRHNLLRPETVESLFIMYRITGNPIYQEWGWEIFQAFRSVSRLEGGYSGIRDVTVDPSKVVYDDTQQSFFLAETLKYLYLLFSPRTLMPLDKFVFNTEAHPLPICTE